MPGGGFFVVPGKGPGVELNDDPACLARIEDDPGKALQLLPRTRNLGVIFAHIDLGHIGAGAASAVSYVEADVVASGAAGRMNLKIGVLEGGVR